MTITTPLQFGWDIPPAPTGMVPIPKGELRVINIDLHNKKEKGLIPIPTPQGGIMWVTSTSSRANNGRPSQTESPKKRLEYLLVTW